MTTILVVDDSEFDRAVVRQILATLEYCDAEFVTDGGSALRRLDAGAVDLVLTDVLMPDMSGLELLERVQKTHPDVPVVIMTGSGSEELVIQALRLGAANYVIKKDLVADLPEIVENVMHSARSREEESLALQHLREADFDLVIPNDRRVLQSSLAFIQSAAWRYGRLTECERTRLGIALEEALSNAMIHGNLEISSSLRENSCTAYEKLIQVRRRQQPYCDRTISISVRFHSGRMFCTIRDAGAGFCVSSIPDPTEPENWSRPCGRGLLLIRSFVDEVYHNAVGNEITLVKRLIPDTKVEFVDDQSHSESVIDEPLEIASGVY